MSKPIIGVDNPALAFMSSATDQEQIEELKAKKKATKTTKKKADTKEIKNYRINLALTESLGEQIKAEAEKQDRSVNKYIELVLIEHLNKSR